MRVILVGQKSFGAAALDMLVGLGAYGIDLVEVWAPLWAPPTGEDALWKRARVLGVPRVQGPIESGLLDVDLIVAAHSHKFLGQRTRRATTLGAIGYHPSLLPRHRGIDAVQWTVHMREPIAGGSVYWFDNGVDTGPICRQDWCHVRPEWSASDLWREELFPMGIRLLREAVLETSAGVVRAVPQDEALATWEPSWERPPLHRPELPEIGAMPNGYRMVVK
jgi:methionyl-tRNA formyltransferase